MSEQHYYVDEATAKILEYVIDAIRDDFDELFKNDEDIKTLDDLKIDMRPVIEEYVLEKMKEKSSVDYYLLEGDLRGIADEVVSVFDALGDKDMWCLFANLDLANDILIT